MNEAALADLEQDPSSPFLVGCIRTKHHVAAYPISHRDMAADARFAGEVLKRLSLSEGALMLLTSGSAEYGQFWPYELATEAAKACVAIAENFFYDAGRSEMFIRRLPIDLAFGITETVLDGLIEMKFDLAKVFAPVKVICARDRAADRLREAGFAPWRMVSFGPTFGYVSPDGETFYDREEWIIEASQDELVITARHERALPLARFRTGVNGSVDGDNNFALA